MEIYCTCSICTAINTKREWSATMYTILYSMRFVWFVVRRISTHTYSHRLRHSRSPATAAGTVRFGGLFVSLHFSCFVPWVAERRCFKTMDDGSATTTIIIIMAEWCISFVHQIVDCWATNVSSNSINYLLCATQTYATVDIIRPCAVYNT